MTTAIPGLLTPRSVRIRRWAAATRAPPMTSTAARTGVLPEALGLTGFHLQRQLRVDVAAVITRRVRKLRASALRAPHVMDRLKGVVRTPLTLARFTVFLDRKHAYS